MNSTTEAMPETEMNAVVKIAAIPTVHQTGDLNSQDSKVSGAAEIAPVLTPKQAAFVGGGAFLFMFMMAFMLPDMNLTTTPASPVAVAPPAAAASTTSPAVAPPAAQPHQRRASTRTGGFSFPRDLTPHHLYDQDYSLTWTDMGAGYTYRIYYSNDKQMRDAIIAYYKPVEGTLYRFTMNGDAKNVWMAVAPIDSNQHEGLLSGPVNIGDAPMSK